MAYSSTWKSNIRYGQAFVAFDRIIDILDKPTEPKEVQGLTPEIKGNIVFKNVSFHYPDGTCPLKDISFEVKQGQTVGVLGPTGCGKSSLMHLLVRLFDYQNGSIKIDGHELKEVDKKWLRSHVGIVLQEPFLFSKSVMDNIKCLIQKQALMKLKRLLRLRQYMILYYPLKTATIPL